MIKILFIRTDKAFLPEIDAYINYFNNDNRFQAFDSSKFERYNVEDFDVIWEMKGLGGVKKGNYILIHDYASLSIGKFPHAKNKLKSLLNTKPDLRIFLNKDVKEGFNFDDNVDYTYRDMGIDDSFFNQNTDVKDYEFVYVGSISRKRRMDKFLEGYVKNSPGKLCLIGDVEDDLYEKYKNYDCLYFTGKVNYYDVPKLASKAIYGINYVPDQYPYNIQTSTKLIEYLALGLKVITTDYEWVRKFEKQENINFYKIESNGSILKSDLEKYEFSNIDDLSKYTWINIIEGSLVKNKILEIINGTSK